MIMLMRFMDLIFADTPQWIINVTIIGFIGTIIELIILFIMLLKLRKNKQ